MFSPRNSDENFRFSHFMNQNKCRLHRPWGDRLVQLYCTTTTASNWFVNLYYELLPAVSSSSKHGRRRFYYTLCLWVSGVTGGWGGQVFTGKFLLTYRKNRGKEKGGNGEEKKENCGRDGGKLKMEGKEVFENVWNFETTEIRLGFPKMKNVYLGKAYFTSGKVIFLPLKNFPLTPLPVVSQSGSTSSITKWCQSWLIFVVSKQTWYQTVEKEFSKC